MLSLEFSQFYASVMPAMNGNKNSEVISMQRAGIGKDLKAPLVILIPAWCTESKTDNLASVAEKYISNPYARFETIQVNVFC